MSTVLWYKDLDSSVLFLADRLISYNGIKYYQDKVSLIKNQYGKVTGFFSGCGDAYKLAEFERWISNGGLINHYPEMDNDCNATAMFVDLEGNLTTYYGPNNPSGMLYTGDSRFITEGANSQMLLGALIQNTDNISPVNVFLNIQEHCVYTGGGVQGYRIYPNDEYVLIRCMPKPIKYDTSAGPPQRMPK